MNINITKIFPIRITFLVLMLGFIAACSDTPVVNKPTGNAPAMPHSISGSTLSCDSTDTYIPNFTYLYNSNLYHVEEQNGELVLVNGSPSFTVHRVIYPNIQYCLQSDHGGYAIIICCDGAGIVMQEN